MRDEESLQEEMRMCWMIKSRLRLRFGRDQLTRRSPRRMACYNIDALVGMGEKRPSVWRDGVEVGKSGEPQVGFGFFRFFDFWVFVIRSGK